MRIRFTLAALMGLVLLAAVAFAALRRPTALWASAVFTATVLLLSTAIVGALLRRGNARAIWIGAAVFGWVYLCFAFIVGSNGNGATPPPILTKVLIDYQWEDQSKSSAYYANKLPTGETIIGSDKDPANVIGEESPRLAAYYRLLSAKSPSTSPPINLLDRRRIGHSLGALLFAAIGALVGRLIAARETSETEAARPG